jgi:hypothetical protein
MRFAAPSPVTTTVLPSLETVRSAWAGAAKARRTNVTRRKARGIARQ